MTTQQAKDAIRLMRHWMETSSDVELSRAVEGSPELQKDLQFARRIDPVANAAFESIKLSALHNQHIEQKLAEFSHKQHHRFSWKDPGVWAMAFACLLLVAYGLWYFWRQLEGFEGMDEAARVVSAGLTDVHKFEPMEVPLRDLDDWLVLQGIEGSWMPTEFANEVSVGARVFHLDGIAIACIAVPENKMLIYVFPGSPLGIRVTPEGRWKIFDIGAASAAIIQKGDTCFLISSRIGKADLKKLIQSRN